MSPAAICFPEFAKLTPDCFTRDNNRDNAEETHRRAFVGPVASAAIARERGLPIGAVVFSEHEAFLGMPKTTPAKPTPPADADDRESQASAIVRFCEAHVDLFHDENRDVYARHKPTGEVWRIGSRAFKDWLTAGFYKAHRKVARDQSVREALATMEGVGRHTGKAQRVFIRVGQSKARYVIDLCEPGNTRCIEIDRNGWRVLKRADVPFVRFESMQQLPEPARGGDIGKLWPLVNVPEDVRLLVVTWLIECLRPETPFPLLEFIGEQGSAKSTTQAALRRILDPNACDLRASPKTPEDAFVAGGASWLVSYENISHLSAPMQDALCVLATGGGFAKRKLYSDADEVVIRVKRPVILNGISAAITAQDLIDRTISIETPMIRDRRESTTLSTSFERDHAAILGALLDIMAKALAWLDSIKIPAEERPRLIEFAKLGMAVAKAMGRKEGEFLEAFNHRRDEAISRTIDASPVATAAMAYIEKFPSGIHDTAESIMRAVEHLRPIGVGDAWPRTPKGFADALRRAAPALRQLGVEVHSLPKTGGVIRWVIERRKSSSPCPASPACTGGDDGRTSKTFRTSTERVFLGDGA